MISYYLKRLLGLIPLLIGITFLSFLVIRLAPGGPMETLFGLNPKVSVETKERLKKFYELDKPVWIQYTSWLGRVTRFDFGNSFADGDKVTEKIGKAVPVTLFFNGLSLIIIFCVGIGTGVAQAEQRNQISDHALSALSFMVLSLPTFWVALLAMSLFGAKLHLFPVVGIHDVFYDEMTLLSKCWDLARHAVLPLFVMSLAGTASIARYTRGRLLETLKQNYIKTAIAKGLSKREVLYRHALKNALLPIITILGLSIPHLLGGSVVVETLFGIPGMGRLFIQSVYSRDYPVIMGILVIGAVLTLLGNLMADVLYGLADPRIRQGQKIGGGR